MGQIGQKMANGQLLFQALYGDPLLRLQPQVHYTSTVHLYSLALNISLVGYSEGGVESKYNC